MVLCFQNCAKDPNLSDYATAASTSTSGNVTSTGTSTSTVQAPVITSTQGNITITAGQPISVTVTASGTTPTFQWQKNSVNISDETATLSISSAATTDSGTYALIASNSAGSSTLTFTITVNAAVSTAVAPAITTPLVNVTGRYNINSDVCIITGDLTAPYSTVTFTVGATGTNITYQWYRIGTTGVATAIIGATTPTYTFSCTDEVQEGTFEVKVTNSVGTVSSSATLSLTEIDPGGNR